MFIKPCDGRVTSPFGYRIHPINHIRTLHSGVDYGNTPSNNTIVAVACGKVTFSKFTNGYANTVMIVHTFGGKTFETVDGLNGPATKSAVQSFQKASDLVVDGITGKLTTAALAKVER